MSKERQIVLDVIHDQHTGKHQVILPEARIDVGLPDKKEIITAPFDKTETAGYKHAPWGKSDKLPTTIRKKIEQVPMAGQAIYRLAAMMFGNGLTYYNNSDLREGNTTVKRGYNRVVEHFLQRNQIITRWLIPQIIDYRFYMQTFNQMTLNNAGDQIVGLYHREAEFSRLGKQNETTFDIDELHYSPKFGSGMDPNDKERIILPLHLWYDELRFFNRMGRKRHFAYHSLLRTPGTKYYARPFWIGLFRKNGWIDASISVPEVVNAMMKNQVRLKYQILIPESYFKIRHFQKWEGYTDAERQSKIDEFITSLNTKLGDTSYAFTSITTVFAQDQMNNELGKIEIIPIDDKVKKDSWVPSANAADAQIVQGLGLHPSQVGLSPDKGLGGAGSGSDQRESFNTGISLNTIDQQILLEPLNYIAQYNTRKEGDEWDITFTIDHTHHTTTNNQESGLEPGDNTLTIE
ncbi:MAG: hypothetical protein HRT70_04875 [Flavobacteriaceae bacterium]|nr:hypothetical protein [Flavobacteriaceae bacterium]